MSRSKNLYYKQIYGNAMDWIKVCGKCLVGEKNSLAAIWKLAYTAIAYISSVFAFTVLLKDLTGFDKAEELCKKHWWVLIIIGIIASLIHNHEKISCKGTVVNDDLQLMVRVSDLFCIRANSYVIPTNTFFRTVMDNEYISSQSVQGAFQIKYFSDNIERLNQMISKSLQQQGITGEDMCDIHGSVKRYPIGTVAKIDHDDKHYYFVAINDVNKFGKPIKQEYNNVEKALNGLWETINRLGHCDDLAMPLIGTGRAAIREATIEKVIENTVNSFISSPKKIARKLIICIRPKDYYEGKADLKTIEKYINYKCEFK